MQASKLIATLDDQSRSDQNVDVGNIEYSLVDENTFLTFWQLDRLDI